MVINTLAKKYDITVRTLRYYETLGLLESQRNEANIRVYKEDQVARLEEILLLKLFGISLQNIGRILEDNDNQRLKTLLMREMDGLDGQINTLNHKKSMIQALMKTYGSGDITRQTLRAFVNEQVYINNERIITMIKTVSNIQLEISPDLIPLATSEKTTNILREIKALRESLKADKGIELALVHVKDCPELAERTFQILQNDVTIVKEACPEGPIEDQVKHIMSLLKDLLIN